MHWLFGSIIPSTSQSPSPNPSPLPLSLPVALPIASSSDPKQKTFSIGISLDALPRRIPSRTTRPARLKKDILAPPLPHKWSFGTASSSASVSPLIIAGGPSLLALDEELHVKHYQDPIRAHDWEQNPQQRPPATTSMLLAPDATPDPTREAPQSHDSPNPPYIYPPNGAGGARGRRGWLGSSNPRGFPERGGYPGNGGERRRGARGTGMNPNSNGFSRGYNGRGYIPRGGGSSSPRAHRPHQPPPFVITPPPHFQPLPLPGMPPLNMNDPQSMAYYPPQHYIPNGIPYDPYALPPHLHPQHLPPIAPPPPIPLAGPSSLSLSSSLSSSASTTTAPSPQLHATHIAPPVPPPLSALPFPLDPTRYWLLGQLEYYLSPQNMAQDLFLRRQMDSRGWIPISLLASFNRVKALTPAPPLPIPPPPPVVHPPPPSAVPPPIPPAVPPPGLDTQQNTQHLPNSQNPQNQPHPQHQNPQPQPNPDLIRDVLSLSTLVQLRGGMVRMGGWERFVLPDAVPTSVDEIPLPDGVGGGTGGFSGTGGGVGTGGYPYPYQYQNQHQHPYQQYQYPHPNPNQHPNPNLNPYQVHPGWEDQHQHPHPQQAYQQQYQAYQYQSYQPPPPPSSSFQAVDQQQHPQRGGGGEVNGDADNAANGVNVGAAAAEASRAQPQQHDGDDGRPLVNGHSSGVCDESGSTQEDGEEEEEEEEDDVIFVM